MADVLYVRMGPAADGSVLAGGHEPRDLLAEGGGTRLTAETPIALREDGPFAPLATAIVAQGALRDVLARAIPTPSLRGYARLRIVLLALTAAPMGLLLELDRELVTRGNAGTGRLIVDLLLVAAVVLELVRRTPRTPGVAAVALGAIALRWGLVVARLCAKGVHPLVYGAVLVPAAAAIAILARAPSRSRVVLELLGKLGISRSSFLLATQKPEPSPALVAAAIACAAGLPALLHLTRLAGAGLFTQAFVFVTFAILAPELARRAMEPGGERPTPAAPARILAGIAVGLATTTAVVTAGRLFFDAAAEVTRCVERLDAETRLARAAESAELSRAVAQVRASAPLMIMTAAIFPFAEERIYRGLLQEVLARRYGTRYGVFAASVAFGVAHLGIYQVALYQTILLGTGFGLAYAEGGLLAAFFVHATWNLLQLA